MQFPEHYIKRGSFGLHSGGISDKLYDVNALLTDKNYFDMIINSIPLGRFTYVGIATAGAIIAGHFRQFAMIKDKELKGKINGKYCLIDDVCITERSLRDAIKIIGFEPEHIFVVLDRRKTKNLKLESLFEE